MSQTPPPEQHTTENPIPGADHGTDITDLSALLQPKGMSPRKRGTIVRGIQYAVLGLIIIAIIVFSNWHRVYTQMFYAPVVKTLWYTPGPGGFQEHYILLNAFLHTLLYTVSAFVLGITGGFLLALMRTSHVGPYRWMATVYTEFFRGVPSLLVILTIGLGLPLAFGIRFSHITLQIGIALGIVSAAYMSETIRAGIQAVPKGQVEAARSLGMTNMQATWQVVIPQAFRIVLPPMTNEFITLTKDTSLVYLLSIAPVQFELSKVGANALTQTTTGGITTIVAVGLCYLIITLPLGFLARRLEKQNNGQKKSAKKRGLTVAKEAVA